MLPIRRTALLALLATFAALFALLGACSSPATPAGDPEADATILAFPFGEALIFRVTLHSVSDLPGATTYNLIGQDDTIAPVAFGEQVDNFVEGTTVIPLEVYDAGGSVLATADLDGADYDTESRSTLALTRAGSQSATSATIDGTAPLAVTVETGSSPRLAPQQTAPLDVLARGVLTDLRTAQNVTDLEVPLTCGNATGPVTPPAPGPNGGFFIINDVLIEYNYAFDNPARFNDVFTIKFVDSDRNFDNMTLMFRLPNSSVVWILRPLRRASQTEIDDAFSRMSGSVSASNPFEEATAFVDLVVTLFGPESLVETVVTRVEGDCVLGAQSFTVQEGNDAPEPFKAFNDRVDKNTQEDTLGLLILGNEADIRDKDLDTCDVWTASTSGGAGTTIDNWDVSTIPTGATFDIRFDAFSIPDKFLVEYPDGTLRLDTGWRGSSFYDGDPAYPGGVTSPGGGQVDGMFAKASSGLVQVTVIGVDPSTAWDYSLRCNTP